MRPSKHQNYMSVADIVAERSHDSQTKVGAVLVNNESGAIMATGYNGFVRGALDTDLPSVRPDKYNYIIHAETNLICNAVRSGIKTDNAAVYCTLSPCVKCLRMLWQAGISDFYFRDKYKDFEDSINMMDLSVSVEKTDDGFYFMKIKPKIDIFFK